MNKQFINAQQLMEDSFRLAAKVYQDGFRPQFIIGIWRGGAPIGIAVQEYFDYKEVKTDHIAVRTSSYSGIDQQKKEVTVHGLHYIIDNMQVSDSLLIVDDVFDTGRSVEALIAQLALQAQGDMAKDVRVACPWYKPKNSCVSFSPDYYLYESEAWLVFPHELSGLTSEEIAKGKTDLVNVLSLFDQ